MITYPPQIAETIPAFVKDQIIIPFKWNPAVSASEVKGFSLLVKDLASNEKGSVLYDGVAENQVVFKSSTLKLEEGQYYKFQLAYRDSDDELTYSSTSIGKYLGEKENIYCLIPTFLQFPYFNSIRYQALYCDRTKNEPLYSYHVKLFESGKLIQDLGEVIHNIYEDTVDSSERTCSYSFELTEELDSEKKYILQHSIKTLNGYVLTEEYPIFEAGQSSMYFVGMLGAKQEYDEREEGFVRVTLTGEMLENSKGNFKLLRAEKGTSHWDTLLDFEIIGSYHGEWKDYTVEQGKTYLYALAQYTEQEMSNKLMTEEITVDFEHMFLSDKDFCLKIKYNPKVSSFKNVVQETKLETIDGRFPFFFRNGKINYKEIPIAGLLSCRVDDDNAERVATDSEKAFSSEYYNFSKEKEYKLKILDWLTNGQPKYFRSPQEGNYIVQIMNVSLSPEDTLGRLIHSFSATGYEVAENNYNNLRKLGIVELDVKDTTPATSEIVNLTQDDFINGSYTEEGIISNFFWYTYFPDGDNGIKLDENTFFNTTGTFKTPEGAIYNKLEIPKEVGLKGQFSFEKAVEVQEYTDLMKAFTYTTVKTMRNGWEKDFEYSHIYVLQASGTGTITIGEETIDLGETGQVYNIKNISNWIPISSMGEVVINVVAKTKGNVV